MIKRLLSTMAVGAMLLTSCSSEDAIIAGGDGNVTFTASLPGGIQGRSAYDDGTVATKLTCAVYDAAGTNISGLTTTATLANKAAQVSLSLVTGKTYTVVFWAEAETSPYTLDTTTGTVTVNVTDGKVTGAANDKNRDAFFAVEKFTVTGAINKEVTLKRPFAQINIGTSDLDAFKAAGGSITTSGLTVKDVPNVLNLIDGTVSGSVDYVYTPAALVADTETFPVAGGYRWLTANYILTDGNKNTVDVEWTSDNAANSSVTYSYVPVQRNYRTNIYGALLINPADYNVKVNNGFDGTENVEIVSVTKAEDIAAAVAAGGTVAIECEATTIDLKSYAGTEPLTLMINNTVSTVDLGQFTEEAPVTIVVGKDVPYPYLKLQTGAYQNLTIKGDLESSEAIDQVTFGGRAVKNVTFENVRFVYGGATTKTTGLYTYASDIDNLTVSNCTFEGYPLAAVNFSIGQNNNNAGATSAITVENCTFEYGENANDNCNGIYILGYHNIVVKNNVVKNVPYHGIFVRPVISCDIEGNTVIGAGEDGIKVEGQLGATTLKITNNNLQSAKNVIRAKTMDSVTSITVTGNTIDMTKAAAFANDEPWGILLLGKGTPVMKVSQNTKVGVNEHWFKTDMSAADGSDSDTPFAE